MIAPVMTGSVDVHTVDVHCCLLVCPACSPVIRLLAACAMPILLICLYDFCVRWQLHPLCHSQYENGDPRSAGHCCPALCLPCLHALRRPVRRAVVLLCMIVARQMSASHPWPLRICHAALLHVF